MKANLSSLTALTICLLFLASGAFAGNITVNNYSFETLPIGGLNFPCGGSCYYSVAPVPDWVTTGITGQWTTGNLDGNPNAYDGSVLAFSNGGSLSQNVATAVAGEPYTLQVEIYHRADGYPLLGVAQLTLNGVPVATATGVDAGPGTWNLFTATYTAGGAGTLGILLTASGAQGDWDNVRLSVPEPTTPATLLGFGIFNFAAVIGVRRKLT